MAYGAYSIAAPQMSLQEELMKRRSSEDPSVDIAVSYTLLTLPTSDLV